MDQNYYVNQNPTNIPTHLAKAIVGTILFWPVGIAAIIQASRVRGLAATDPNAAWATSHSANKLANIAIIIGCVSIVVSLLFYFVLFKYVGASVNALAV